jgi:hypothetical protein
MLRKIGMKKEWSGMDAEISDIVNFCDDELK